MKQNIINIQPLSFPWPTDDPFLFCAYHRDEYPAGNAELGPDPTRLAGRNIGQDFVIKEGWRMYHGTQVPGFPYHPHRGFETITINKEGFVDHTDSLGAAGRFGAGDVQWMTAGKGVQHSEMFPLLHQDKENPLEIFQVWLNLPSKSKFVDPHFKMLWSKEIPVVETHDEQGHSTMVNIIAGQLEGQSAPSPTPNSWALNPDHGVAVWTIKISGGGQWTLPASDIADVKRSLYFYRGDQLQIDSVAVPNDHRIQLDPDRDVTISAGKQDCFLLLLQGKPINEPVAQHGPFVMNTQEEIMQAFADYRRTEFGGWPWPNREQVHARDKGRFALYADGHEESP